MDSISRRVSASPLPPALGPAPQAPLAAPAPSAPVDSLAVAPATRAAAQALSDPLADYPLSREVGRQVDLLSELAHASERPVTPLSPDATAAETQARGWWVLPGRAGKRSIPEATIVSATRPYRMPVPDDVEQKNLDVNQASVTTALATLPPADQARYAAVTKQLGGNLRGQLALQVLLLKGTLTGGRPDSRPAGGGQTLLANLAAFAAQRPALPLDGGQVLSDALSELAAPETIAQGSIGTCAAASVQIWLARENPAEYVRLLGGVSSPAGTVTLQGGDALTRVKDTLQPDQTGRSSSSRLLEAAFMAYARGPRGYTNDLAAGRDASGGLYPKETAHLLAGLAGEARTRTFDFMDDLTIGDVDASVLEAAHDGLPVFASLIWGARDASGNMDKYHEVLITGVKDGIASYMNPWGQQETMPWVELTSRLTAAIVVAPL